MKSNTNSNGFTIVELLIVIVVIAILAAISIVAYNGIQNRSYNATVKSDISNLAKQIQLKAADTGEFPEGGGVSTNGTGSGNSQIFPNFSFAPSKNAYATDVPNLWYCTGVESSTGQKIFKILARSKSGQDYTYASNGVVTESGSANVGESSVCSGMAPARYTFSYGYYHVSKTWNSWIN